MCLCGCEGGHVTAKVLERNEKRRRFYEIKGHKKKEDKTRNDKKLTKRPLQSEDAVA